MMNLNTTGLLKRVGIVLTVALVVAVSGIRYLKSSIHPGRRLPAPQLAVAKPAGTDTPVPSLRHLLAEPRQAPGANAEDSVSLGCREFWDQVEKLDLEDLGALQKTGGLPSSADCLSPPDELAALQKDYQDKCAPLIGVANLDTAVSKEKLELCTMQVFLMRAGISSWQTRDQKLAEITDLRLLSDKLAYGFSKLFGDRPNAADMIAVAERILELDPRIYGAAKASLVGQALGGAFDDSKKGNAEYWNKLEPVLNRARNMNASDPELEELSWLVRTKGLVPDLMKTEAESTVRSNPSSARGYLVLAYSQWKLGERAAAMENLQHAMQLEPDNEEMKKIWENTHAPDADENSFKLTLRVGINFNGIF